MVSITPLQIGIPHRHFFIEPPYWLSAAPIYFEVDVTNKDRLSVNRVTLPVTLYSPRVSIDNVASRLPVQIPVY